MATKEDILEQIVEEHLSHLGYFVRHNIKFLPRKDHPDFISNQDSNHSDIDVIGLNPSKQGADRIVVVSCKSWQSGFDPSSEIKNIELKKNVRGREAWKGFRELSQPKWSEAFLKKVFDVTGSDTFTYITAVSKLRGRRELWENYEPFRRAVNGNPIRIITFAEMFEQVQGQLTKTLASTEVGRMIQLLSAAGMTLKRPE